MVTACVKVLDAPVGQHTKCSNFWTQISSVSLDDVVALAGIFAGCHWFSIWVKSDRGMKYVYDSQSGFDYRFVDSLGA